MDETTYVGPFADGEYAFFLPLLRASAFEREASCGLWEIFDWIGKSLAQMAGETVLADPCRASPEQCVILIRNALIGGGKSVEDAKALVNSYCYPARPGIRDLELAWRILEAALYGIQTSAKKKTSKAERDSPSA